MQLPTNEQLTKDIEFQLTSNQAARIKGENIIIDIFRGSDIRRNRHKVGEVLLTKNEAIKALADDTLFDMVTTADLNLNIPIYTLRDSSADRCSD